MIRDNQAIETALAIEAARMLMGGMDENVVAKHIEKMRVQLGNLQ